MKKYTIDVTADDIANGCAMSCRGCPIALAASRAMGRKMSVSTHHIFERDNLNRYARLPTRAQNFVFGFDHCQAAGVAPFTFEVELYPNEQS